MSKGKRTADEQITQDSNFEEENQKDDEVAGSWKRAAPEELVKRKYVQLYIFIT